MGSAASADPSARNALESLLRDGIANGTVGIVMASKRPLLEISSLHGSSEMYDPGDTLSDENAGFTFSRSVPGAHYARDAWAAGLQLGVIAASDNHAAQPGQPHGGLTAVRAGRLTREGIFDGLAGKRTYGTTGQRVYLDVTIAGVQMGQSGATRGPVDANMTIPAPSDIERVELIRRDFPSGDYTLPARVDGAGRLLQTTLRDGLAVGRVMYYVRLQLKEPVRGRIVRAWTSPVLVERGHAMRSRIGCGWPPMRTPPRP